MCDGCWKEWQEFEEAYAKKLAEKIEDMIAPPTSEFEAGMNYGIGRAIKAIRRLS